MAPSVTLTTTQTTYLHCRGTVIVRAHDGAPPRHANGSAHLSTPKEKWPDGCVHARPRPATNLTRVYIKAPDDMCLCPHLSSRCDAPTCQTAPNNLFSQTSRVCVCVCVCVHVRKLTLEPRTTSLEVHQQLEYTVTSTRIDRLLAWILIVSAPLLRSVRVCRWPALRHSRIQKSTTLCIDITLRSEDAASWE